MLVHVKKKAQITIPSKIREVTGVNEGDFLDITVRNDEIVLKPVTHGRIKLKPVDMKQFSKLKGIIAVGGDALKESESLNEEDNI